MISNVKQKVSQELSEILDTVNQVEAYLEKLAVIDDDKLRTALISAIALNLHAFYGGAERIFIHVAKTIDRGLPTETDWHRQLLLQMATAVDSVRAPLISETLLTQLDDFRRFRHVVRSNYTHLLEQERVVQIAEKLGNCYHQLRIELDQWLDI